MTALVARIFDSLIDSAGRWAVRNTPKPSPMKKARMSCDEYSRTSSAIAQGVRIIANRKQTNNEIYWENAVQSHLTNDGQCKRPELLISMTDQEFKLGISEDSGFYNEAGLDYSKELDWDLVRAGAACASYQSAA